MSDSINILIRAILEKSSKSQLEQELKNIEQKLKPVDVKIDSKGLDKLKETLVRAAGETDHISQITKEWTKQLGETVKQTEFLDKNTGEVTKRITENTINYKKQQAELAKINVEQSKYWTQRRKETLESMINKPDELIKMADYYKTLETESEKYNQTLIKQDAINEKNKIKSAQLSAEVFANEFKRQDAYKKTANELQKLQQNAKTTNTILKNFGSADHHKKADELTSSLQKLNIVENATQKEMQETINKAKLLANQLQNVSKEAKATGNNSMTMGQMIHTAFQKFSIWIGVTSLFFGTVQTIKLATREVIELNTAMTELNKVLEVSKGQLADYTEQAFILGDKLNRTGKDVLLATAEFARAGYQLQESAQLAEQALLLTNIADGLEDTAEASGYLIAILKGYNKTASDTAHIVNLLNEVSNNYAVNTVKLAEGLQRTSGTLSQTGTSVEQLTGILTGGYEVLRNMEKVSTGLITISSRLRGISETGEEIDGLMPKLQSAFKEFAGIDIQTINGELRSTYDILSDLSTVWSTLNDEQRAKIGELASGIRQAPVLNAILLNWKNVEGAAKTALNSTGSAIAENEKYMASLEGKINDLTSALSKLAYDTISSDLFGSLIDLTTSFVKLADKIGVATIALGSLWLYLSLSSKFTILIPIIDGLAIATGRWAISMGLASTAAGVLATAVSTIAPIAIVMAIYGVIKVVDKLTISLKEQKEIIQTLSSDIQNLQSEYDQLKSKDNKTEQETKHLNVLLAQIEAKKELIALNSKDIIQKEYIKPISTSTGKMVEFDNKPEKVRNIEDSIKIINDAENALKELDNQYLKLSDTEQQSEKTQKEYNDNRDKINKSVAESTDYLGAEYQTIQDNIKILEDAGDQQSEEYIILTQLSKAIEEVIGKTNESTDASSEATSALEQHEKAVSTLATTYKESSASIKDLKNILSELDEGKGLSVDSISKILESYPELIDYLDDEVKLREKITDKVDDYQDAIYDAFVAIKQNSNEFYNSVKNENVDLFNNLAKAYNSDIDNWSNLAQAKQEINAKLISQLGADWVKYFEAFNVGNTLINPSSIGDWRRLESGDALAIDSTTAKQFELLNALNETTRKQAEKFKNLNVSSSLGSSSSSFSSSSKYISDQYALSISALNTEISQLEGLLSKLNPTSEEYRQKLQQINSLTKQKQTLTEQEAIRLRALRAETAKGTEEYDNYTKSIESLSSAWWDFENSMSDNSFKIINSQLSAFDETIDDLNNQLSRSKTLQSALFEETEEYNNELLKQKNITDNLITSLKQKEQYIQKELASGKLSIAQNKELTTTLKQVKEAQEDLYISYLSDLKTYADEVKNIYQDMADSAIEAINDQMDIEDKRHDRIMDGYKDELKAIQEIINAKLDLIDEEENEADYQKELSKLLSERQDIQNQINALQMDDSIEAKMQLKKLNQELVDKQDEIEEKQHKHTVDLRKKNLQDQLKLYEKDIEEKQDAEDKKYKAEKNRLEDIKDDIKNYLNNILNDERNLLSNVKGDFNNFANFINDNMGRIGTSIKNKFSDKLDDVIEKINNVKYQINNIEIPINIPSSGGSNTDENINNWINSNLSTILSSYKSAGISTYTNPYTGVTYNTSTGQIISGSSNNGGNSNSRNKNNSSSNNNNSSSNNNNNSNNNSGSIGGVNNDGWEVRDNGSGGFEYVYVGHKGGIIPSYHSGGEVGSKTSNKTLDLVNKMFNVKPNEMVIKALREELMAPKQNVLNNFMPNLRNLVNSMTPNINFSPALAGTTNKNYYLTVNVDNLHTNNKKETNQVFNTMLKGIKKYS